MLKQRIARLTVSLLVAMSLIVTGSITALAAAPSVEDIEYKGNGRVEVDFHGDVRYKRVKITVKDTKGKKYKVKSIRKDDDDIKFTIKNFKKGRTYRITIKGVKRVGTAKYGKVKGKVKIPAAANTGSAISKSKAIEIAKNHASKTWGAKGFWDVEAEKDRYGGQSVWEVDFDGTINGQKYEFEYKIAVNGGKILRSQLDD